MLALYEYKFNGQGKRNLIFLLILTVSLIK
jgi:hypothetical protein